MKPANVSLWKELSTQFQEAQAKAKTAAEQDAYDRARSETDELPACAALPIFPASEQQIVRLARRPQLLERRRPDLVVAVELENPFAHGVSIAARDRRSMAHVVVTLDDEPRLRCGRDHLS